MLRRRHGSRDSNELPDEADDPSGGADDPADEADGVAGESGDRGDDHIDMLPRPPVEQLSDARLLFDCSAWSRDDRAALDAALGGSSIDRVWQGPELVVGLLDEHLVEEAFDDLGVRLSEQPASGAR